MDKFLELCLSNNDLYTKVLESINDAIFIADMSGRVLWLNKVSANMCGLPKEKLIGRNVKDLEKEGVFSPSVTRITIETGENISTVQMMNDGGKFIVTGHIVRDNDNQPLLTVVHSRDITKAMENTSKMAEIEKLLETYSNEIKKITEKQSYRKLSELKLNSKSKERLKCEMLIERIAKVDTNVLITGGTGTGKSVAAKMIHDLSDRKDNSFMEINCASLPETLIESELFGYEKGSFTGASASGKLGLIQAAEKGTLFLDEIGELPLHLQAKLLHFLQNKEYLPIGSRNYKTADVRIIAATNKNLENMIEKNKFRSDLYYRLNILGIKMPELKNNEVDILEYSAFFLNKFNKKHNLNKYFSDHVIRVFKQYTWPGNLRELENLIERLVILTEEKQITESDLPQKMFYKENEANSIVSSLTNKSMPELLEDFEKKMIIDGLNKMNSTRKAAEYLGVTQSLVMRRIKKYNIKLEFEKSKTFVVDD